MNRKGFGLIELMVAVAIVSVLVTSFGIVNNSIRKQQKVMGDRGGLDAFMRSFPHLIADANAWKSTVARNGNTWCLRNGGGSSCPGGPQVLGQIYDSQGYKVYDWTGQNGITEYGVPCGPTVSSAPPLAGLTYGALNCPVRFEVRWTARDPNPYPLVEVAVNLVVHPYFQSMSNISSLDIRRADFRRYSYSADPYAVDIGAIPATTAKSVIRRTAIP